MPNVEPLGIGLGEPRDELHALRQLDDAEAERHLAAIAGRPVHHAW